MKKMLNLIGACMIFMSSIFAGPFGDIARNVNALDSAPAATYEGNIPEGQELFPILYRYVHDIKIEGDKITDIQVNMKEVNLLENAYTIQTAISYKASIGYQVQESEFNIKADDNKYSVTTTRLVTYNIDKKGNRSGDYIKAATKSMNTNTKNVIASLDNIFSNTQGDDYANWYDRAYSDLEIQIGFGEYAPNKLKAKKWFDAHSLVGKKITFNLRFADIRESKSGSYAYEVTGAVKGHPYVVVYFYTDDDKYIDLNTNDVIEVCGTVSEVVYYGQYSTTNEVDLKHIESQLEYNDDYKIKYLEINE